jgi:protein gp37
MGESSKIEWCHHTFNPWWGCTKVSQACKSCYAEAWAKRTGHDIWGEDKPRRFFGEKHWREPLKWNREALAAGERRRVFCASMADVFENRRDLDVWRAKLWALIIDTPGLDWMLLTKRPENCGRLFPRDWWIKGLPDNIWLGCTFDDEGPARADVLTGCTARVKFLSVEPLIKEETLKPWIGRLHLVIVGGESGAKARPMQVEWVRKLRDECKEAGVAFFLKQKLDERGRKVSLPLLDGRQWAEMPNV